MGRRAALILAAAVLAACGQNAERAEPPIPAISAPELPERTGAGWEDEPVDPTGQRPPGLSVLHARFTSDVEHDRTAIDALGEGDVCVRAGGVARSQLNAVVALVVPAVSGRFGADDVVEVRADEVAGQVVAVVALEDGTLQPAYDERFGPGVVVVSSLLQPVGQ